MERWEGGRVSGDGGRGVAIVLERLLLCSAALICFFFPLPLLILLIRCRIILLMIH